MPGHLIRRLHQSATQIFQQRLKAAGFDMTPVQFGAMAAMHDRPGIDQASIAATIAYDRATIGGVIDRLESKGWVVRKTSTRDRRAREVRLSEDGVQVFEAALPHVRDLQPLILQTLSEEEQVAFLTLAKKANGQDV